MAVAPPSPPFPNPHAMPPINDPCVGKVMQEGLAYVALLNAFAAMQSALAANNRAAYITAAATYRNAMSDFLGKWNTAEDCLHKWFV